MLSAKQIQKLLELSQDSTSFYLSCKSAAALHSLPYPGQYNFYILNSIEAQKFTADVEKVARTVLEYEELINLHAGS